MKQNLPFLFFIAITMCLLASCEKDETRPTFPLSAEIFESISGQRVAFNALTHSAESLSWDFGDGNTSTEKNPVHVYEEGGYYVATLTAKDSKGNSVTKERRLALSLTPMAMLVGDHTAEGYQGKTWKMSSDHEPLVDYFAIANAGLTTVKGTPKPLPTGIFGQLGFGNAYTDEFTFHHDGSYKQDVKADGASFGGLVYQIVTSGMGNILVGNEDYGLCIAKYTPEDGATFTFVEDEDFTVQSVYGALNFKNAMTLDFSGSAFLAFRDFQQKVVVNKISNTRIQVIVFMAAGQDPAIIGVNTHALFLTLEAVN